MIYFNNKQIFLASKATVLYKVGCNFSCIHHTLIELVFSDQWMVCCIGMNNIPHFICVLETLWALKAKKCQSWNKCRKKLSRTKMRILAWVIPNKRFWSSFFLVNLIYTSYFLFWMPYFVSWISTIWNIVFFLRALQICVTILRSFFANLWHKSCSSSKNIS